MGSEFQINSYDEMKDVLREAFAAIGVTGVVFEEDMREFSHEIKCSFPVEGFTLSRTAVISSIANVGWALVADDFFRSLSRERGGRHVQQSDQVCRASASHRES